MVATRHCDRMLSNAVSPRAESAGQMLALSNDDQAHSADNGSTFTAHACARCLWHGGYRNYTHMQYAQRAHFICLWCWTLVGMACPEGVRACDRHHSRSSAPLHPRSSRHMPAPVSSVSCNACRASPTCVPGCAGQQPGVCTHGAATIVPAQEFVHPQASEQRRHANTTSTAAASVLRPAMARAWMPRHRPAVA